MAGNNKLITPLIYTVLVVMLLLLNGCNGVVSPESWAKSHVGGTLDRLYAPASAKVRFREYLNERGDKIVVDPTSSTCEIHYNLGKTDVVGSYSLIGKDCR